MTSTIVDLDSAPEGYRPDGKAAPRWAPDLQLVPAMLCTPRWPKLLTDYEEPDRCWVVAGLTLAGWSAEEITERIGGSIRLIRDIRSKPMTAACTLWQTDINRMTDELRLEQIELAATRHALTAKSREAARLQLQIDRLLDAHIVGADRFPRCGHPMDKVNVYEHGVRKACRECDRIRKAEKRKLAAVS